MKLNFSKISNQQFDILLNGLRFVGTLNKKNDKIILCEVKMNGKIEHVCDRCGADMFLEIDEDIEILLSSGIYKDNHIELENVFEFFEDEIDLNDVFVSEVEAYKSDCFYCEKCKNL